MAGVDFSRWGVVGYRDNTGIGRMVADLADAFGFGARLAVPSERLATLPLEPGRDVPLHPGMGEAELESALAPLEGIVTIERHSWHPRLLPAAKRLGLATVCVPMWEWFDGWERAWGNCDLFACPHGHCLSVVEGLGHRNARVLPWPLDLRKLPRREIAGPARFFIHNAGIVDPQDRKGTAETVRAFRRVKREDIRLLVRMQKPADVGAGGDPRIEVRVGDVGPVGNLYAEGDAAIQPSKLEGLGFMVLEPVACGIPTITLDGPPMNLWVTRREMLAPKRFFGRKAYSAVWYPQARLRLPSIGGLAKRIAWAAGHDLGGISSAQRAWAEREFDPGRLRDVWAEALAPLVRRKG